MTKTSLTRAALIALSGDGSAPAILGKSPAERQLDFALAAGCSRVILIGDGAGSEAIALRHRAEAAKAGVQIVSSAHALVGSVRPDDELLVLQEGLLPESADALQALRDGPAILAIPAGIGVQAGFERIDLERASAGALIVHGAILPRLLELPEDSDVHGALLRIALQQRLPEKRLPQSIVADGAWAMIGPRTDAVLLQEKWIDRHLAAAPRYAPSRQVARFALLRAGGRLLPLPQGLAAIVAGALIMLAGAGLAAWNGLPAIAFALIALAAPSMETAIGFARLKAAPFRSAPRIRSLRLLLDAAILFAGYWSIDGIWFRQAFPPLVLVAALHTASRDEMDDPLAILRDRGVVAAAIAVFAGFGVAEAGIMAIALAVLAANFAANRGKRR